MQGMVWSRDW